jgi:hypothetical protein
VVQHPGVQGARASGLLRSLAGSQAGLEPARLPAAYAGPPPFLAGYADGLTVASRLPGRSEGATLTQLLTTLDSNQEVSRTRTGRVCHFP